MRFIRVWGLMIFVSGSFFIQATNLQGQIASKRSDAKTRQKLSPKPIRITEQESLNFLVHKVKPSYPEATKKNNVSGTVVFEVLIDAKDGKVKRLKPISGPDELIPAAEAAAKEYVYDFLGSINLYTTQISIRF